MTDHNSAKKSIGLRLVMICALSLILLLPTFLIIALINDRQITKEEAINNVGGEMGRSSDYYRTGHLCSL